MGRSFVSLLLHLSGLLTRGSSGPAHLSSCPPLPLRSRELALVLLVLLVVLMVLVALMVLVVLVALMVLVSAPAQVTELNLPEASGPEVITETRAQLRVVSENDNHHHHHHHRLRKAPPGSEQQQLHPPVEAHSRLMRELLEPERRRCPGTRNPRSVIFREKPQQQEALVEDGWMHPTSRARRSEEETGLMEMEES